MNRFHAPAAAPEPPGARLRIHDLRVGVGQAAALVGVSLEVDPGEVVAITGEPGSGKTTLMRTIAGDLAQEAGTIVIDGRAHRNTWEPRPGVALAWQDLELSDNLDVAGALLLGEERRLLIVSPERFHARAAARLRALELPIRDTATPVAALSSGQRQLLAIAKAVHTGTRVLLLDDPTAALGADETAQVERIVRSLRAEGTAILFATRDVDLMLRLSDRIVVLRHGRVAAVVDPRATHPDDIAALSAGRPLDTSARRQLTRLHGLTGRLVSADPSSSLSLIVSALAQALGSDRACIHVASGPSFACAASLGFTPQEVDSFSQLDPDAAELPVSRAATTRRTVIDLEPARAWPGLGPAAAAAVAGSWSAPVSGPAGVGAVITVFRPDRRAPERDELDLLTLYAGYAAAAVERDRLLDQVTARNRVLEAIREMLQRLAGPVAVGADGLSVALVSLRRGLEADEVCLLTRAESGPRWRAYAGPGGTDPATISTALARAATDELGTGPRDGTARIVAGDVLAVPFNAPGGPTVLAATWSGPTVGEEVRALIEDAAHSLNLALEREEAGHAHQEAAALRRSRELQRGFLSRLSHELRTPLTAIRGYASSLLAPDVTWDAATQQRFLQTIAAESARLGRLVDDLLDFSMIESGVMRLQLDWCDIPLVVDAALSCLPPEWLERVAVSCDPLLPAVWADHDRLEQVFVNLLTNAFKHNPPETCVRIAAGEFGRGRVAITVADDGDGFPPQLAPAPFDSAHRPGARSTGAGLGLSIARGIVAAHGGTIILEPVASGTCFRIELPVEAPGGHPTEIAIEPRAYA